MAEGEPAATDETAAVSAAQRTPAPNEINWTVRTSPGPTDGFAWSLWTDDPRWLPMVVTGWAASKEEAGVVAETVADRCTSAACAFAREAGTWDVTFALMNAFPDAPVGGGLAVGRMSLTGDEPDLEHDRWSPLESRAVDWQTRGGRQKFVALDAREEQSGWRLRELFGCMGTLGEQATLAVASARDLADAVAAPESPRAELIRRGWAEHVMHWTMAAGHMLQNVVGRVTALDPTVRPHLVERQDATSETSRSKALGTAFPHESDAQPDWPTFNKRNANYVRRAAAASSVPEVVAAGELLHRGAVDPRWVAMSELRGEAFHRWRAQTAGVATTNRRATRIVGDDGLLPGGVVPDVRGPEGSAKAIECAESALELLGDALEEFDDLLPPLLRSLTATTMHADGLVSSHGPVALIESSRGTGVMMLPIKPEAAPDFVRAIAADDPADAEET